MRLLDLQLLYGVAGAREQFEQLCAHLIRSNFASAKQVRCDPGDGGVDVYIGNWDDPEGIAVFQVKYFPTGIRESQKKQIRTSFYSCVNNSHFKTQQWTLCLPIELSETETSWFTRWKHEQSVLPNEAITWWGESDLVRLLLLPENAEIREHYFQQQHFTQIREMYGMLKHLLDGISMQPSNALHAFAARQDSKEANLRYKEDVYIPLHVELKTLLVAFEQAHVSKGSYPQWITVTGEPLPHSLRYVLPSSHGLAFHLWPSTKNDFRMFGALTASARQLLDTLTERITDYNHQIEIAREAVLPVLIRCIAVGLEHVVRDPGYLKWKANYRDAPIPPPYTAYSWFELIERNTVPEAGLRGDAMAKWWLGHGSQTLGWLLADNPDQAAKYIYEDYERRGAMPQSEFWFQDVCRATCSDLVREDTYRNVLDAQAKLFQLLAQIESMVLNVLLDIQYRYEGGPPPL